MYVKSLEWKRRIIFILQLCVSVWKYGNKKNRHREQKRKRIHSTGPFFENQDKEWINIIYTYKMCIYIYIYMSSFTQMEKTSVLGWLLCNLMLENDLLFLTSYQQLQCDWEFCYMPFSAFHQVTLSNLQLLTQCYENTSKWLQCILILWTSYTACVNILVRL